MSEIQLRVEDARKKDVGKGIARISEEAIQKLGVSVGDIIVITGKRSTPAIVCSAYKEDQSREIIRIDGFLLQNSSATLGEYVNIQKEKAETAVSLTIAPVGMRLNVDDEFTTFVKKRLIDRVLTEGDLTTIRMLWHAIPFMVAKTFPEGIVKIDQSSKITILNEPCATETDAEQTAKNIKSMTSWESSADILSDSSDQIFANLIEKVMNSFFFDYEQFESEQIAKETAVSAELVQSTVVFLKGLIWSNLKGDLSINSLRRTLLDKYQFSETKTKMLLTIYEANKNELRFSLMFSLLQDLNAKLEATTESEYFPAIAKRLTELKDLYGHTLDVCSSTKENVSKLQDRVDELDKFVRTNGNPINEDKRKEAEKKRKLW